MTWGHERLWLWTHTRDKHAGLVSEVDLAVKGLDVWKSFASGFRGALGLCQALERLQDVDYLWIYRFEPKREREEQEYRNRDDALGLGSATILSLRSFGELVPLLDLLQRSDVFFVAAHNLMVASENHGFCQECALRPPEHRVHDDHEPAMWERALVRPKLEAAIVQATRAVEALIGKSGDRKTYIKLDRVKRRWTEAIDLDPEDEFAFAGTSYLDYYYRLFEIRGTAAHSLGRLPFELDCEMTIGAQSFAWLILNS